MENYNFWADLFDTFQSSADWIKALLIITLPAFFLGLIALFLHYRLASSTPKRFSDGDLIYTVHRDGLDRYLIHCHSKELEKEPTLLLDDKDQLKNTETM